MFYGYIRVSTTDQAAPEKTSLEDQERKIRGCLAMRMDEPEVEIFRDECSGSLPLEGRPGGALLAHVIKPGDTVIFAKLDRIFRSLSDAVVTIDDWHKRGVEAIALDISTEPIASNGVGKMFFGIMASVAEFERWRILERMAEGKRGKRRRKGHTGGLTPYGYRVVGRGKSSVLVDDEAEARVVEMMVDMRVVQKMSLSQISDALAAQGIMNRIGKPFAKTVISSVVTRRSKTLQVAE